MAALLCRPAGPGARPRTPGSYGWEPSPPTRTARSSPHPGAALGPGFLQCPSWAEVKDGWRPLLLGWGPEPEPGGSPAWPWCCSVSSPAPEGTSRTCPRGPSPTGPTRHRQLALTAAAASQGRRRLRRADRPAPAHRRWRSGPLKRTDGPGMRLADVLDCEVDPLGTAVAERLRARGWRRCGRRHRRERDRGRHRRGRGRPAPACLPGAARRPDHRGPVVRAQPGVAAQRTPGTEGGSGGGRRQRGRTPGVLPAVVPHRASATASGSAARSRTTSASTPRSTRRSLAG